MSQKDWIDHDYYAELGVDKSSSPAEIKKAYRKLAQKTHPDANQGDPGAEERFKNVSQAYDVLSDVKQRQEYDRIRQMVAAGGFRSGPGGRGAGASGRGAEGGQRVRVDLGDMFSGGGGIFDDLFGSGGGGGFGGGVRFPQKGDDHQTEATLSFEEALDGATLDLRIEEFGGARTVKARIPGGVSDGSKIKLAGKGEYGRDGGPSGDLYVRVRVRPHKTFGRKGKDVTLNVPISFVEATLGAQVEVPTMNGSPVTLKIPAGTPTGKTFRVRGKGSTSGSSNSDLLVTVQVAVPTRLSSVARELVERLGEALTESPREALDAQKSVK
ncbi:MAG: DnaJ C-terminal domain-containing protein [Actinomycetota bacterium]